MSAEVASDALIKLTAQIVVAHVGNNMLGVNDVYSLITSVHSALISTSGGDVAAEVHQEPKVSVRASIKPDYLICLEDGKRFKMLKRHLMKSYQMTPDQYRRKWGLNSNYPMVAPNYAEQRRALAKAIGLGTKGRQRTKTKAKRK